MTDPTPAQQQAALLRAVADHLDTNPHLRGSVVRTDWRGHGNLQLFGDRDGELRDLVAWAHTLDVDHVTVSDMGRPDTWSCRYHLHLHGDLAGIPVDVWSGVEVLNDADIPTDSEVPLPRLPLYAAEAAARRAAEQARVDCAAAT